MNYNSQMPAMPTKAKIDGENKVRSLKTGEDGYGFLGLTKREMFAMHAMQGILANNAAEDIGWENWAMHLAQHSITAADALLKELEK